MDKFVSKSMHNQLHQMSNFLACFLAWNCHNLLSKHANDANFGQVCIMIRGKGFYCDYDE